MWRGLMTCGLDEREKRVQARHIRVSAERGNMSQSMHPETLSDYQQILNIRQSSPKEPRTFEPPNHVWATFKTPPTPSNSFYLQEHLPPNVRKLQY